jgi:hypothetical protein
LIKEFLRSCSLRSVALKVARAASSLQHLLDGLISQITDVDVCRMVRSGKPAGPEEAPLPTNGQYGGSLHYIKLLNNLPVERATGLSPPPILRKVGLSLKQKRLPYLHYNGNRSQIKPAHGRKWLKPSDTAGIA